MACSRRRDGRLRAAADAAVGGDDARFDDTSSWLVVAIGLIPGVVQSQPMPGSADQRADDLAVSVALLHHPSLTGASDKRAVVVIKELVKPPLWSDEFRREENLRRFLKKPAPSTIDAFLTAVRREGELPLAVGQRPDVTVVPSAELARELEAPGRDYWRTFARTIQRHGELCRSRLSPMVTQE